MERMQGKIYQLINGLIEEFPSIYQFSDDDLNKFILLLRNGAFLISIWTAGKDLMKHSYHLKKLFIVN